MMRQMHSAESDRRSREKEPACSETDLMDLQDVCTAMMESLRYRLDMPFHTCMAAAECVLEELKRCLENQPFSLNSDALSKIQMGVISGQENMVPDDAKRTNDYKQCVKIIEDLVDFRNSSDNREQMWPGGSFPSGDSEAQGGQSQTALAQLHGIFKSANPVILSHTIEYPGEGHPEEYKLFTVIGDEMQWLLQNNDHCDMERHSKTLHYMCGILLTSMHIHSKAAVVISRQINLRSDLFRVATRILKDCFGTTISPFNTSSVMSALLKDWMRVITCVGSTMSIGRDVLDDFPGENPLEEAFPNIDEFFLVMLPKLRFPGATSTADLKEQFVALIVAVSGLNRSDASDPEHGLCYFLNRYLSSLLPDDDVLEFFTYVVIRWWNHHGGGSVLDGTNVARDVGLHNSIKLVSSAICGLLTIRVLPVSLDDVVCGVKFISLSEESCGIENGSYYLLRDNDFALVREINARILADFEPSEPIYEEALVVSEHVKRTGV